MQMLQFKGSTETNVKRLLKLQKLKGFTPIEAWLRARHEFHSSFGIVSRFPDF
jgi:hypothetical protein